MITLATVRYENRQEELPPEKKINSENKYRRLFPISSNEAPKSKKSPVLILKKHYVVGAYLFI
jgi:hypothetical protein